MPGITSSISDAETAPQQQPLTAVVLGAGVAGLLSAHVACRQFDRVILVERDRLQASASDAGSLLDTTEAQQRRGIPQYAQPHTLAMGGLEAMEQLLPGFHKELVRRGGVELDLGADFRFFDFGRQYVRGESCLKSVGASRPLIQSTLQAEVLQRNGSKLLVKDGCRTAGLLWNDDKSDVLGVELEGGERVLADLVIEASGRSSKLPQWLKAAGHAAPPVMRVDAGLTYVGRMYRMPADWDKKWLAHITLGRPHGLRGGGMVPVEGRTWQMVLWGINGLVPPMDEEHFLQYAKSLPDPEIYNTISKAERLTPLCKYGGAFNLQRGYDKVPLPGGVLVVGDAVQALNPVYAQGMSVAAKSADALAATLAATLSKVPTGSSEARRAAVHSMGPAFQKQLAAVVAPAWMMATSEDMRYPGTKAEGVAKPPRLLAAYIDGLIRACHYDIKVLETFFGIAHMVRPPHHMFHPRLLVAGIWQMVRAALETLWASTSPAASDSQLEQSLLTPAKAVS